jgi:hypothetical protein
MQYVAPIVFAALFIVVPGSMLLAGAYVLGKWWINKRKQTIKGD